MFFNHYRLQILLILKIIVDFIEDYFPLGIRQLDKLFVESLEAFTA